jgi:acetyl esterase/lipase
VNKPIPIFALATASILLLGQTYPAVAQTGAFDRWDRNGDDKLTRDELPQGIRGNFARVDTNSDGVITREEDARFRARGRNAAERGERVASERRPPRQTAAGGIRTILDIPYAATDNPRQRLDLLLPESRTPDAALPVVVFVHGGGWRGGDKRSGHERLRPFVVSGRYAGVSIGYRLSGEATWPAQIHDCQAAIRWIRAHADKHQLDANRIGVWGASAGGHLVAMLGTSAGVPALDGQLGPHTEQSTDVACVVDFFGPTDFLQMDAHRVPGAAFAHDPAESPESRLIGGAIQEHPDRVATANPISYVSGDEPPFLIVHGDADLLVPIHQSELLDAALRKAEVDVTLVPIQGAGHGLRGVDTTNQVTEFLNRHLRKNDAHPIRDR